MKSKLIKSAVLLSFLASSQAFAAWEYKDNTATLTESITDRTVEVAYGSAIDPDDKDSKKFEDINSVEIAEGAEAGFTTGSMADSSFHAIQIETAKDVESSLNGTISVVQTDGKTASTGTNNISAIAITGTEDFVTDSSINVSATANGAGVNAAGIYSEEANIIADGGDINATATAAKGQAIAIWADNTANVTATAINADANGVIAAGIVANTITADSINANATATNGYADGIVAESIKANSITATANATSDTYADATGISANNFSNNEVITAGSINATATATAAGDEDTFASATALEVAGDYNSFPEVTAESIVANASASASTTDDTGTYSANANATAIFAYDVDVYADSIEATATAEGGTATAIKFYADPNTSGFGIEANTIVAEATATGGNASAIELTNGSIQNKAVEDLITITEADAENLLKDKYSAEVKAKSLSVTATATATDGNATAIKADSISVENETVLDLSALDIDLTKYEAHIEKALGSSVFETSTISVNATATATGGDATAIDVDSITGETNVDWVYIDDNGTPDDSSDDITYDGEIASFTYFTDLDLSAEATVTGAYEAKGLVADSIELANANLNVTATANESYDESAKTYSIGSATAVEVNSISLEQAALDSNEESATYGQYVFADSGSGLYDTSVYTEKGTLTGSITASVIASEDFVASSDITSESTALKVYGDIDANIDADITAINIVPQDEDGIYTVDSSATAIEADSIDGTISGNITAITGEGGTATAINLTNSKEINLAGDVNISAFEGSAYGDVITKANKGLKMYLAEGTNATLQGNLDITNGTNTNGTFTLSSDHTDATVTFKGGDITTKDLNIDEEVNFALAVGNDGLSFANLTITGAVNVYDKNGLVVADSAAAFKGNLISNVSGSAANLVGAGYTLLNSTTAAALGFTADDDGSYDGNSINYTLIVNGDGSVSVKTNSLSYFADGVEGTNQKAIAAGLDGFAAVEENDVIDLTSQANQDLIAFKTQFDPNGDLTGTQAMMDALIPQSQAFVADTNMDVLKNQNNTSIARISAMRDKMSKDNSDANVDAMTRKCAVSLISVNQFGSQDGDSYASGYDFYSAGALASFDYIFSKQLFAGIGIGGNYANVSGDGISGSGETTSFVINAYADYALEETPIDFFVGAGYSHGWNDSKRTSVFGSPIDGSWDSNSFFGFAGVAYTYQVNENMQIKPMGGINLVATSNDSYSEDGEISEGTMSFDNNGYTKADIFLGAEFSYDASENLQLLARAFWSYNCADEQYSATTSFNANTASSFDILGSKTSRSSAVLGLGAAYDINESSNIFLNYNANVYSEKLSHNVNAGFKYSF